MEFNLANIFELAVDTYPDREYIVADGKRCTYREMDERANRLAHHLAAQGIGKDDHVGIYAYNCMEWIEILWAVFKLRAVWININYRYVADELEYIFNNADLKALVFQREFAPLVHDVRNSMPTVKHMVMIEDGSQADCKGLPVADYEAALAAQSPARDFPPRSGDDLYMLYTGGTTGLPKGVIWRHEDVFFALGGGIDQTTLEKAKHPMEVVKRGENFAMTMYPLAPLMHGASQWAVMGRGFEGHKLVLSAKFDPERVWREVAAEKVNALFITGDAMARPLVEAYERVKDGVDASSLFLLVSSAVVFSSALKDQFHVHFPNLIIIDSIGASESGGNGLVMVEKGKTGMKGGPTVRPGEGTVVLDPDTLVPLPPGTGRIGLVARAGHIPLGYYKDAKKTAETFITGGDGKRYAVPGDSALLEADGTLTMLGRGSQCINSGGEKIFTEEVESAVKSHPDVYDVTVVGVPDERWGSTVCAVVQLRDGATDPGLESIQAHCRKHIAGYKLPRKLVIVGQLVRAPSGKPDYRWAKATALAALGLG